VLAEEGFRVRGFRGMRPCARLGLAALLLALAAGGAEAVERGDPAPGFSLPALQGSGSVSLAAHRGKLVYLDFWASWCPPCLSSLPQLEALRRELPADRVQIVAVNLDKEPAKARQFLAQHPIGYPSGSDPQGRTPESYGLETMPTSYLIDSQGVVRYVHEGFRKGDIDEIRSRIQALLEGKR